MKSDSVLIKIDQYRAGCLFIRKQQQQQNAKPENIFVLAANCTEHWEVMNQKSVSLFKRQFVPLLKPNKYD